jgi:DNA-binding protein HU-beta
MPAVSSTQSTVTLKHLAALLAKRHKLTKKQTAELLEGFVGLIRTNLKRGARIRIGGLGILRVRDRPARVGRNPRTGEMIQIKARKKVAFRAAKELRDAV